MAGLLIMIVAVIVGFNPSIWSILMLFATTLFGGYMIKKNYPESYEHFLRMFSHAVIIFNMVFVGMVMLIDHPGMSYVDKASAAFLNILVILVMITLLKLKKDGS